MSEKKPEGIPISWFVRQPKVERLYQRMIRRKGGDVDPELVGALSNARDAEAAQREAKAVSEGEAKVAPFRDHTGRTTQRTKHIRAIVFDNPNLPWTEHRKLAVKSSEGRKIIGDLSDSGFRNQRTAALKELKKPKI